MKAFNKLSFAQAERLALLAEECGETIQIIGKILRHGFDSSNPDDDRQVTNREMLERELGDIQAAQTMLVLAGDIRGNEIKVACAGKQHRVRPYLHHQK